MKTDLRDHPEAYSKIIRKHKKQNGRDDEDHSSRQEPRTENEKIHSGKRKTRTDEAS